MSASPAIPSIRRLPAPTRIGGCGRWTGTGKASKAVHCVVLTLEGQGGSVEQPLEHLEGFLEPADPNRRGSKGMPGPLVLVPQPAGPDAQLQTAPDSRSSVAASLASTTGSR
jgi:hypothetical protein